jgi:hypothetical protein
LPLLALFANFKAEGDETAKKTKNVFYKCVLEFNLATVKMSKSLYPTGQAGLRDMEAA